MLPKVLSDDSEDELGRGAAPVRRKNGVIDLPVQLGEREGIVQLHPIELVEGLLDVLEGLIDLLALLDELCHEALEVVVRR